MSADPCLFYFKFLSLTGAVGVASFGGVPSEKFMLQTRQFCPLHFPLSKLHAGRTAL